MDGAASALQKQELEAALNWQELQYREERTKGQVSALSKDIKQDE